MKKLYSFPHLLIVDGLRALAIIWIVWLHIWQQSWWSNNLYILGQRIYIDLIPRTGFLGVELFLFISGFGLYYSYLKRHSQNGKFEDIKTFAFRRILRIYPSYLLSILIILLVLQPFSTIKDALTNIGAHLLFIHNLFPQTFSSINGVIWVLGVEAQFYLIFPIIARIFFKKPLLTFLVLNIVAIIYRNYILHFQAWNIGFFINQVPGFLDIYVDGMLSAYLIIHLGHRQLNFYKKTVFTFFALFSFAFLFYVMNWVDSLPFVPNVSEMWQASYRWLLGLIFISIVFFSNYSLSFWKNLLSNRIILFISTISYNLFLWHQLIAIQLKTSKIPPFVGDPHSDFLWQVEFTLLSVLLSVVTATIITFCFEIPIRKYGFLGFLKLIFGKFFFKKRFAFEEIKAP